MHAYYLRGSGKRLGNKASKMNLVSVGNTIAQMMSCGCMLRTVTGCYPWCFL